MHVVVFDGGALVSVVPNLRGVVYQNWLQWRAKTKWTVTIVSRAGFFGSLQRFSHAYSVGLRNHSMLPIGLQADFILVYVPRVSKNVPSLTSCNVKRTEPEFMNLKQ